jgi:hypothetical protein
MDLNRRFSTIPPNHLACFTKTFLIVSEDDEIVEGCQGVSPRRKARTDRFSSLFCRSGGHG